ncbi:MAG TPA: HAD family hydrolase [Bacteroidia bacterium]|nr:HAD family hydrolase [Bacteroidia bacterium]HNU33741.1 HAD family hydrolase [Bacteroidia bacterium]
MNRAIFLDRDGVINLDNPQFTYTIEGFSFNEGIFEALKLFQSKGFIFVIITNQSGIARKIYEHKEVAILHDYMLNEFANHGIKISEIYYCPHLPQVSNCLCRKPDSISLEKAIARFNIDAASSYFIGDRQRDADAAIKVGVKPILIEENTNLNEIIHLIV